MTRTVNCLEEERRTSSAARTRPTAARSWSTLTEHGPRAACSPTARRRDAWLAQRLRELTPDERAVLREAAPILERLAQKD